jgi:nematocidal protein AidA
MSEVNSPVASKADATTFASSVSVDILVVVDTDAVLRDYPRPSQNPDQPTMIGHQYEFMIATGARQIFSGQGTGDLSFRANPGDTVAFRGTSIYANADSAIIVYGITKYSGTNVFNTFQNMTITRNGAVMPKQGSPNGLPATQTAITFSAYQSMVAGSGSEGFIVCFALYKLDDNGQKQNLVGYYGWDPNITVN